MAKEFFIDTVSSPMLINSPLTIYSSTISALSGEMRESFARHNNDDVQGERNKP